jgi:hypothetical protein
MDYGEIAFITVTNAGYLIYTKNCLKSLKNSDSDINLKCYCIGKVAHNELKSGSVDVHFFNDEKCTTFQRFRSGNWSNVTHYKFKAIHENLQKYKYVCITDGDIVYKDKRFIKYCMENIGDHDILIQNDTMTDEFGGEILLCTGFMFIKSNNLTKSVFDPVKTESNISRVGWDDQIYINEIKKKINYKLLPLSLFPNGRYFYKNHENIKPYMIHFNWLIGHDKFYKMKKHGEWFSDCYQ